MRGAKLPAPPGSPTPLARRPCLQVPRGLGVIQGDGISYSSIGTILKAVLDAGFSAEVRVVAEVLCCCVFPGHCEGRVWRLGAAQVLKQLACPLLSQQTRHRAGGGAASGTA